MSTRGKRSMTLAQALKDEVDRHIASHHSLAEFAKRFNISKAALSHAFKKLTSKSLLYYLEVARSEAAIVIMRRYPERKLRDIAREVGYESEKNFRYAFRTAFGRTPTCALREIRKQV